MTKHASVVSITNPVPGGSRFTSLKAAQRYVAKGRARLSKCGKHLVFIEDDHRNTSVSAQALLKLERNRGYDSRGLLTLQEIRHIPCVLASNVLVIPTKARVEILARSGKVKILVRNGTKLRDNVIAFPNIEKPQVLPKAA